MTLDDLERQSRGFYGFFWLFRPGQVYIIHKAAPQYWRLWRGVVVNAFGWNEVTLHRAWLVLWWVTACGQKLL